mmetsp:Transcript_121901/g.352003  ORF Transcript_121901/g.352003 Transcript_121901/m.352003 type:complete len:255 (+) Transcript_121901:105-869(+)
MLCIVAIGEVTLWHFYTPMVFLYVGVIAVAVARYANLPRPVFYAGAAWAALFGMVLACNCRMLRRHGWRRRMKDARGYPCQICQRVYPTREAKVYHSMKCTKRHIQEASVNSGGSAPAQGSPAPLFSSCGSVAPAVAEGSTSTGGSRTGGSRSISSGASYPAGARNTRSGKALRPDLSTPAAAASSMAAPIPTAPRWTDAREVTGDTSGASGARARRSSRARHAPSRAAASSPERPRPSEPKWVEPPYVASAAS